MREALPSVSSTTCTIHTGACLHAQGLHTKVAQVAAAALGLPLGAIYIAETATDKVPNASPTAASASSDMYGAAGAAAIKVDLFSVRLRCHVVGARHIRCRRSPQDAG